MCKSLSRDAARYFTGVLSCFLLAAVRCFAQIPTPTRAASVSDFFDSLGVCTHIGQGVDDAAKSAACLSYAGLRHLRDDGNPAHIADWITVYKQSGVKTCLLTNHDIAQTIAMAKQLREAGALLAVEGPNEPNNWPVTYEGQKSGFDTTALPIARFQRDLYQAVKREPALKNIPVFHSSEAGGSEKDNVGLQFLTIPPGAKTLMPDGTKYADYANTHNYVCGHSGKRIDNVAWNATDPTRNGDWDGMYAEYGLTWHGKFAGYATEQLRTLPKVSTETGWRTRGKDSITEEEQGCVFLNLYLDGFKQGWKHTFIYMLRDDPNQGYWGLFDAEYKPKKSAVYLHNLTTILSGNSGMGGKTPAPKSLTYAIPTRTATVHDLLLQKNDGAFALIVWNEKASGSDNVTIELGRDSTGVKLYDPTKGTAPIKETGKIHSLTLELTDHPVVLLIPAK